MEAPPVAANPVSYTVVLDEYTRNRKREGSGDDVHYAMQGSRKTFFIGRETFDVKDGYSVYCTGADVNFALR